MTLSGPEALRSLEEALRDVRREEDEISKRLARSAELIARTRETEGQLFRKLAQVRLDPATQEDLSGRLSSAELKARAVQKAHGTALTQAEQELAELDRTLSELSTSRSETLKLIAQRQDEIEAVRQRIKVQLHQDAGYTERRAAAEELATIAASAEEKTTQAEADREQKGRPYRDDPLFMYLWERGYGTPQYKTGNITRMLDGWVARLIRFQQARPNYAMLNDIPLRLREHATRQAELAASAQQELAKLEDAAIDGAGGKPASEALEAAEARLTEIDAKTLAAEDKRDEVAKRLRELAQGDETEFTTALAALAETLGGEDIATLLADARATRTGQDDALLTQIDAARARAAEEERDTREQKARLKTLADRRRELEDIQYEFKKSRFDDPRSRFGEDRLAGDLLTEFLRGGISAANYWGRWRQSQSWQGGMGPWTDEARPGSGGGFSWPDSSFAGGGGGGGRSSGGFSGNWGRLPTGGGGRGSPGGGSFSRPRTGSMGTRTHGGFKTGGGF